MKKFIGVFADFIRLYRKMRPKDVLELLTDFSWTMNLFDKLTTILIMLDFDSLFPCRTK
jgi:hypothetical protein